MSEYEAEVYEKFSSRVQRQVQSLRVLLDNVQAKGKERHWVRHQTSGDLDDAKLIDGLTGEKTIYKKRADQDPEASDSNEKNFCKPFLFTVTMVFVHYFVFIRRKIVQRYSELSN